MEQINEWRRFEIINSKRQEELEKLLKDKNISREDLILIFSTMKIKE